VLVLAAGLLWLAWRPTAADRTGLSGYIEGEPLYLASPVAGSLTKVAVVRGQRVAAGDPLFVIDERSLSAQRDEAAGQVAQTGAQTAAAEASRQQLLAAAAAARATAEEARRDADRAEAVQRASPEAIARQDVDRARASARAAEAQYEAAQRQADAAGAQVGAAAAQVSQAQGALADRGAGAGRLLPARRVGEREPADRQPAAGFARAAALLRLRDRDGRLPPGAQRQVRLRRLPGPADRGDRLCEPDAGIHPARDLQPRAERQAGAHGRGAAGAPRSARAGPAGPGHSAGTGAMTAAIEVEGLNKSFGRKPV